MEVTSFNFLYMLEMLLPAIGLCIPLKKRKHGMGKAMAIIIVGTCLLGVLPIFYIKYYGTEMQQGILWVESVILMFVWFVLIWAILIFSIYFCTESSIYEAMYIFALSYGVEHIFYCIRVLVEHFTSGIIGNKHPLVYIPCLAGSFLLAYFWFAKGTVYEGKYPIGAISATTTSVVLMGIVWGLSIVMDYLGYAHIHSIYAILCCLFILTNQREQMKRETERIEFSQKEQLWEKTKLRYEMSKESIAVVNQHYHDMKHQLMILSTMSDEDKRKAKLQDMESKIAAYDAGSLYIFACRLLQRLQNLILLFYSHLFDISCFGFHFTAMYIGSFPFFLIQPEFNLCTVACEWCYGFFAGCVVLHA